VLLASQAAAEPRCFRNDDSQWTITVNDHGVEPEMLWNRDGELVSLAAMGAGTGIPRRYAYDLDGELERGYLYLFVRDVLVFDMDPYYPISCD
jgi:hypothetical protein